MRGQEQSEGDLADGTLKHARMHVALNQGVRWIGRAERD